MSKVVKVEDGMLICPECDGNNLHHADVSVFNRQEDDEMVMATHVMGSPQTTMTSRVKNTHSQNPSSRRHGLIIEFECEHCDVRPKLQISQHKGNTIMGWK